MNENNSGLPITGVPEIANSRAAKVLCQEGGRLYQMPISSLEKNIFSDMDTLKEYGVCFDHNTKSSTLLRVGNAVGKTASFGVANATTHNDFDKIYPYSNIRRCTLSDDGKVTSYQGDANYVEDGSVGQVMVEIPKFYFKREFDESNNKEYLYISRDKLEGYIIPDAFVNAAGEEIDAIYIAAYHMSVNEETEIAESVRNAEVNTDNIKNINNIAKARGDNWHNIDIAEYSVLEILFMIEWATTNSESVFAGAYSLDDVDYPNDLKEYDNPSSNCSSSTLFNIESTNVSFYKGMKIYISYRTLEANYIAQEGDFIDNEEETEEGKLLYVTSSRRVTNVELEDEYCVIYFDGAPVNVDEYFSLGDDSAVTGVTNNVIASSGICGNGPEGSVPFVYRGIENLFSTACTWLNGIVMREGKYYVTADISQYGVYQSTYKLDLGKYHELSYNFPPGGYVSKLGYDREVPWAIMPDETNGSSEDGYCDEFIGNTNIGETYDYVFRVGGNSALAGGLFSSSNSTANAALSYNRGRLAYRHYQ